MVVDMKANSSHVEHFLRELESLIERESDLTAVELIGALDIAKEQASLQVWAPAVMELAQQDEIAEATRKAPNEISDFPGANPEFGKDDFNEVESVLTRTKPDRKDDC
jgi:hypothetical protein